MFQHDTVSNNHINLSYMNTSTKIHQNFSLENLPNEIWADILNYKGKYQVSNLGRVKSLKRFRVIKDRILTQSLNENGYLYVNLTTKSVIRTFSVHQLVAIAFLNHKPSRYKFVVDHINNISTDNNIENLQIVTNRKNASKDRNGSSSKFVGVSWSNANNKWMAMIYVDGNSVYLGYFDKEYDAYLAYQNKLKSVSKLETNRTVFKVVI